MSVLSLLVLLIAVGTVFAQKDSPCSTPNGENATCIPLGSCQVIVSGLLLENSSVREFAQLSQCGDGGQPLVCCGTLNYLNSNVSIEEPDVINRAPPTVVLVNFNTKELPDRTVCGLGSKETRITGGEITDLGEFPWMAALEYKRIKDGENAGIRCGGSIVNNKFVMTAAHCIVNQEFELTRVWLGEWKISTDPDCQQGIVNEECADKVQKLEIAEQFPHPYYSRKSGDNDIGLLELEEEIEYTDYIRPICMPPQNLPIPELGSLLTVSGWGSTKFNSTSSDIKLKVAVPLVSNHACIEKLKNRLINSNQLCAGGEAGQDTCQGDSGGPLMRIYEDKHTRQQNQWYQEGVVAWGVGCGISGYPAVYTRVTRYMKWILSIISND